MSASLTCCLVASLNLVAARWVSLIERDLHADCIPLCGGLWPSAGKHPSVTHSNASAQVAPSAITTSVNLVSAGRQDSLS